MISRVGDPTLNKASEWLCKVCGHSEDLHNDEGEHFICRAKDCVCDGFEDME